MNINGYTLQGDWITTNSGFSKWGFAVKNRREYFIKELITPVYPMDPAILTPQQFESSRAHCYEFEQKFKKFYSRINEASRGNLVRINEFFRHGSRYYVVTEKVHGLSVSMEQIAAMPEQKKLLLMKTVAQGFRDLHAAGIVHFDVKPTNILLQYTQTGNFAARIIDFDAGFLLEDPLEDFDFGGDLTYFAPETFLGNFGEEIHPDDKADVFALGLVFHEYYFGKLPEYLSNGYDYPCEAALNDGYLQPDSNYGSRMVIDLIADMLQVEPEKRPAIGDVLNRINNLLGFQQQPDANMMVRELEIDYGGSNGRAISLTPERIRWWNTTAPSYSDETPLPQSYFDVYEMPLTPESYQELMESVMGAGLLGLMSTPQTTGRLIISGAFNQSIQVCYRDGTQGKYTTRSTPPEAFGKIVSILEQHCTFPSVDGSEVPISAVLKTKEAPKAPPVGARPAPVAPTETTSAPSAWFSQAGDL
ncbi:MAG: protein kinase [Clostridia bacterium]|nr:protein kinase [Clostridia bacterium]